MPVLYFCTSSREHMTASQRQGVTTVGVFVGGRGQLMRYLPTGLR